MQPNKDLQALKSGYLFTEILHRTKAYQAAHPEQKLLRIGIGDVTRPLPATVIQAMHKAVDELSRVETFRGYGLEEGYLWLRECILAHDYVPLGIQFDLDEVYISDGAGSDLGNLSELFAQNNRVAVLDPSYPAYVDANLMAGREITYLPSSAENGFVPDLPKEPVDIIYLCFPNNPTGTTLTHAQLALWVEYARQHGSIIIFDAAYEAYITSPDVPHSIYEIEGAKEVAIEVRSYSKTAGFTSVRCGYTIVPKQTGFHTMWQRRQNTKYNGTSYISQRAAEATYSPEGKAETRANIAYYQQSARVLLDGLRGLGYDVYGGVDAPYIWCHTPKGLGSWDFFDRLLNECQVVCVPGSGFGNSGEGYVRFSAFAAREDYIEALDRMKKLLNC